MYIDLHCHTTASDGKLTPTQLIKKAKQMGFSWIAKTDHDNTDLTEEFLKAGRKFGVNAVPGIEISSKYKNKSVHILGLSINHKNKKIIKYSHKCRLARKKRGLKMVEKLKKIGFKIKKSEIDRDVIVRPHVAYSVINHQENKKRLVKEFGKIPSFSEFIQKYLAKGCSCFVLKPFYIEPQLAIKIIKEAGGLTVLGHPKSKTSEFSYDNNHLLKLLKLKFDAIEVYASAHTQEEIKYLKNLAKKHRLLVSAGSDYHGIDQEYALGVCDNGKYVDEKKCQELLEKISN